MTSSSYIERVATTGESGKRLYINIDEIRRNKGVNSVDMPIPTKESSKRQLLPVSGQINDFNIQISIRKEASSVGYTVLLNGSTISDAIQEIIEQYIYIYDILLSHKINAKYKLYLDYLNKTYYGQLKVDGTIIDTSFTSEIVLSLEFKESANFLNV